MAKTRGAIKARLRRQAAVLRAADRNSVGSPKNVGNAIFDFSILFMGMINLTTGPRPIVFLPLPDVFEYNFTTF